MEVSASEYQKLKKFRKAKRSWTEIGTRKIWNPFCLVEEKVFEGQDPVFDQKAWRKVMIFYPEAKNKEFKPLILIPPTGGSTFADRLLAVYLAQRGFTVFILKSFKGWNDYTFNVERHQVQSLQSMAALKELYHWIGQPVYVVGASLGALYGLQAFAADPNVKKMVLVVAGEGFTHIMAKSRLPIAVANKEDRKEVFGLQNDAQYEKFMDQFFTIDPGLFADEEKDSEKYLLFIAERDQVVPTANQLSLAQMLPLAKKIYLNSGHVSAVLTAYLFRKRQIYRFLIA